jgi:hypothetical protein
VPDNGQHRQRLHATAAFTHRPAVASVRAVQTKPSAAFLPTVTCV